MATEASVTEVVSEEIITDETESSVDLQASEKHESTPESAIKISRQFMILLEDYRYLLNCYQETCDCHINFDHQYFYRKLEEKYNLLANLSADNPLLSDALDDDCSNAALNDLWYNVKDGSTNKREALQPGYIKRIKIDAERPTAISQAYRQKMADSPAGNSNNNKDAASPEPIEQNDLLKSELTAYRCTHTKCDFITFRQEDIAKHFNNHSMVDSSKKFNKNDVLYVCDQCGKEFSAQKWLDNHVENVHANVKIYACDHPDCSYKSKFRCVMDDHKKRHGANREFKCTWENCTSEFVTKRDMLAHINFLHKGIKNYTCTWEGCSASFKDSNRLRHHLFTHTGERPYKCDFSGCAASFKQMPHLHKHKKTHIQENVRLQKRITCICPINNCNLGFPGEDELKKHVSENHLAVPQLFKCETENCNLYFVNEADHRNHLADDHNMNF